MTSKLCSNEARELKEPIHAANLDRHKHAKLLILPPVC